MAKRRKPVESNEKRDRWTEFDLREMLRLRKELAEIDREIGGFVKAVEAAGFAGTLRVDGGAGFYDALKNLVIWLRRSQELYDQQRIEQRSASTANGSRKMPSTSTP